MTTKTVLPGFTLEECIYHSIFSAFIDKEVKIFIHDGTPYVVDPKAIMDLVRRTRGTLGSEPTES